MMTGHRPKSDKPFDSATAAPPDSGSGIQSSAQQQLDELHELLKEMQSHRIVAARLRSGNYTLSYILPPSLFARLMIALPDGASVYKKHDGPPLRKSRKFF
jgi:hypothetical protein